MREIYVMAVLNLQMSWDWYPPQTSNHKNADLKVGDLILIKTQAPHSTFVVKYKPVYCIVKKIGEKAFDVQDQTGKIKRVSSEHIQFMYPAEHYLTALLQKEIFGRTVKHINHPDLMPDLYKDLEETEIDKETSRSFKHADPNHPDNATHNYNLHSRTACRLKWGCEYSKMCLGIKIKMKIV